MSVLGSGKTALKVLLQVVTKLCPSSITLSYICLFSITFDFQIIM